MRKTILAIIMMLLWTLHLPVSISASNRDMSSRPGILIAAQKTDVGLAVTVLLRNNATTDERDVFSKLTLGFGIINITRNNETVFTVSTGPVAAPVIDQEGIYYTIILRIGKDGFHGLPGKYQIGAELDNWRSEKSIVSIQ
jgi:hypothetical protein